MAAIPTGPSSQSNFKTNFVKKEKIVCHALRIFFFANHFVSNMSLTQEQIIGIVTAAVDAMTKSLSQKVEQHITQFERLTPKVETYEPVKLTDADSEGSLDLIKSLPEFKGDIHAYPAWRDAKGIFRNKTTGAANAKLTSFNTVLNF